MNQDIAAASSVEHNVMSKDTSKYLVLYILAPVLFLTAALTGGIRFQIGTGAFQFVYPPLLSCIVGAVAMILLARCGAFRVPEPDQQDRGVLDLVSRIVLVGSIYLATVQVFNAVTPERGLLSVIFNIFYLLILINDFFVVFNPRRVAGALVAVLGFSFLVKYVFLANLMEPASSWGKYLLQELMKAGSLGLLDQEPLAPATGYLALFCVGLYGLGLYLIAPAASSGYALLYKMITERYTLTRSERARLRAAIAALEHARDPLEAEDRFTSIPPTAVSNPRLRAAALLDEKGAGDEPVTRPLPSS